MNDNDDENDNDEENNHDNDDDKTLEEYDSFIIALFYFLDIFSCS